MKMRTAIAMVFLLVPAMLMALDFEWLPGGQYDPSIPTPKSFLGYEIGSYLTDHYQMLEYMHRLADSSDRVQIFEFGETYERRKMILLVISSKDNMNRLEAIRRTIARLKDPRATSASEAETIAKETPPIGWINFGTDGNETSAFEASMQLAYQLASGTDPLTIRILENVVTIINPCLSPDSHQWFATWAKAMTIGRPGTPDPAAAEHRSAWFVSTDGNHYLIDVNRDAFALTQAETQAVAKVLHHWNPQIWADNHGQPEEYFFAPFASPINRNYPPTILKWATEVGKNIARNFDRFGWTYVKAERYDLYYPGYWDAYPAFSGAIGMTYETNGGGSKGFVYERSDGTIATLKDSIHHHFIADMATLEVLADNKEAILKDYYDFRKTGIEEAARETFKHYILPKGGDEGRLAQLVELMLRHQIEVYRAEQPISYQETQTYFDRQSKPRSFPAASYVLPLNQPQKRLLKVLFEPDPLLEQQFLDEVNATRERNKLLGSGTPKEPLFFYDITAWSLPLTFGIEGAAFTEDVVALPGKWRVTNTLERPGGVIGGQASYAYVFPYDDGGAKMAGVLLQEDYNVALALKGFANDGREYAPGTLVVRVARNPKPLHDRVPELAESCGVEAVAVNAGWAEKGISFGSVFVKNLKKPKIMVLTHQPTRATMFGSVYTLLDQRFGLKFSAVRTEHVAGTDLSRYNVIVMPDGSAAGYERLLGESGVERLKSWIERGGTLVAIKGAAAFTTREGVELTDVQLIEEVLDREAQAAEGGDGPTKRVESLPGSIFKATLNNHYYLGVGYPQEIAVQVRGAYLFSKTVIGTNVATFPESSHIMGHKWEDTEAILAGKLYLADVPVGEGHVILFADDPTFRGFWRGLDRLVLSAILFAPAM